MMGAAPAPPTPPVLSRVWHWVHETFIGSDRKPQEEEEAPAEFTCAICFEVLTNPVALPRCRHHFCRLCVLLMMEAHLDDMVHQPWHAPLPPPFSCPRCRAEIDLDVVDFPIDASLAEAIQRQFPNQAAAKAETTHTLEREMEALSTIARLTEELVLVAKRRVRSIMLLTALAFPVLFFYWAWRWLRRAAGFLVRLGVLVFAWRLGMDVGYYFY